MVKFHHDEVMDWIGLHLFNNDTPFRTYPSLMTKSWHGNAFPITGPCEGYLVTGGFPSQRVSNVELYFFLSVIGLKSCWSNNQFAVDLKHHNDHVMSLWYYTQFDTIIYCVQHYSESMTIRHSRIWSHVRHTLICHLMNYSRVPL